MHVEMFIFPSYFFLFDGRVRKQSKDETAAQKKRKRELQRMEKELSQAEAAPKKKRGRKKLKETTASEKAKRDTLKQSLRSQVVGVDEMEIDSDAAEARRQEGENSISLTKPEHNAIWKNKRVGAFKLPVRLLE